jgi:hypothetical protein
MAALADERAPLDPLAGAGEDGGVGDGKDWRVRIGKRSRDVVLLGLAREKVAFRVVPLADHVELGGASAGGCAARLSV